MPRESSDRERQSPRRPRKEPESDRERKRRATDDQRRRKGHQASDSTGALLPKESDDERRKVKNGHTSDSTPRRSRRESTSRSGSSNPLSASGLAQLDALNAKKGWKGYDEAYLKRVRAQETKLEKERKVEARDLEKEQRRVQKRAEREEQKRAEAEEQRRLEEEERDRETETEQRRAYKEQRDKRRRQEKRAAQAAEKEHIRKVERDRERAAEVQERDRRPKGKQRRGESDSRRRTTERRYADFEEIDSDEGSEDRSPRRRRHSVPAPASPYKDSPRRDKRTKRNEPMSTEYYKSEQRKRRVVSGALLEKGEGVNERRKEKGGNSKDSGSSDVTTESMWKKKRNRRILIYAMIMLILLAIVIAVGVVVSKKKGSNKSGSSSGSSASNSPSNGNLAGISQSSIPDSAKGGYLDPFSWYDTHDFNVTYTDATVGGLPLMGLNSTWDDSIRANDNVPALSDAFQYGTMPIRGMNVGGWLSIEPFITPSFFQRYGSRDGVIDEWTLTSKLGSQQAKVRLEQHYSSFINAQTFADIRAAGFDHVRIPFSYWAVTTYDGDPYVPKVSFRYLLRGIEYARQNGLRVKLDIHGLPGSQNGWNHSGRQGYIGWLNGTDGDLNAQRSLDIHNQLSQFFAQPRYQNIITMYGLVNEPRMTGLDTTKVLAWYSKAISLIRGNNVTSVLVFGDGFMGLDNWQGKLQQDKNLLLDVHQYVIFNNDQMKLVHKDKITFACKGWTAQMQRSMNRQTGFGPTMCGEWSQADTDCATYLNDVGVGNRWQGTLNTGNATTSVLDPQCPTKNSPTCDCGPANADPSTYSTAYKDWLYKFALAQMDSFEQGWGWFYWTWQTEAATQWSYKLGMKAGILPQDVRKRDWTCSNDVPDYAGMGLPETY